MREGPVTAVLGRSRRLCEHPAPPCAGDRKHSGTTGKKFPALRRNAAEGRDRARLCRLSPLPRLFRHIEKVG